MRYLDKKFIAGLLAVTAILLMGSILISGSKAETDTETFILKNESSYGDKDEKFFAYLAETMEKEILGLEEISSCDIVIVRGESGSLLADVELACITELSAEREDSIRTYIAKSTGVLYENVLINVLPYRVTY